METVTMDVVAVDGDKITLKDKGTLYETERSLGDRDVFIDDKVIVSFNKGRLWFWVYWQGNKVPVGGNSVMLPNQFTGEVRGYCKNMCLIKVGRGYYWIPAWCRVPSGQYNIKVTCRYTKTMRIARWKIVGDSDAV